MITGTSKSKSGKKGNIHNQNFYLAPSLPVQFYSCYSLVSSPQQHLGRDTETYKKTETELYNCDSILNVHKTKFPSYLLKVLDCHTKLIFSVNENILIVTMPANVVVLPEKEIHKSNTNYYYYCN